MAVTERATQVYAKRRSTRSWETPHGPVAAELGAAALNAFDDLEWKSIYRSGTKRLWLSDDRYAFETTMEYLVRANNAQTTLLLDSDHPATRDHDGVDLETHMGRVHDALPFTESERHWLLHLFYDLDGTLDHPDHSIRRGARREQPVLSAGRLQPLDGQGVVDRWYAWRRDIFEFEGQAARAAARGALLGIGEILVPNAVEQIYGS